MSENDHIYAERLKTLKKNNEGIDRGERMGDLMGTKGRVCFKKRENVGGDVSVTVASC